jgi:hypothetical protein
MQVVRPIHRAFNDFPVASFDPEILRCYRLDAIR